MIEINSVICGDSREILKEFPDKFVDLVLSDPPYGINLEYDNYQDSEENWYNLMKDILPAIIRVSKMVIIPSTKIAKPRMEWIYKNFPPDWLICWYKGSPGHASYVGFNDWEPHLVYGRTRNRLYMHDFFQTKASPTKGTFAHPCPKPIEWADWLIERATIEGDLILDPFCGSGTVLVSAKNHKRNFIGIDISKKYCTISEERLK